MTNTEQEIRNQLGQALINRAEADEKIVQCRAMLQALKASQNEAAAEEAAKREVRRQKRRKKKDADPQP